ncbi:MAG: phosphomannomutase/phosphoglucomutase [Oscillospiraceae bacterium]|jgi:phosphomannomutase|nr:phosphomannomutase/phosphoglucomutase [Oscillospiraceae bacterium]
MDLQYLKSGTDIRGTALGESCDLRDEVVCGIISAFVAYLEKKLATSPFAMSISVGHDSRLSSRRIKKAVIKTLSSHGVKVYDCSLSSTPAMFMTCVALGCSAAVQITASHHPKDKNGLKFFTRQGGFEAAEITEILEDAPKYMTLEFIRPGSVEAIDFMARYALTLREMICRGVNSEEDYHAPLKGFHIVVDAGNGVGGFYATHVLQSLGADITGSQFLEPDGSFPNHTPNPENAEAMRSICGAVVRVKADLGVIFDTDVDRAACVGPDGKEINRNRLVALASVIALEKCPGGTIVTDSVTSDGLKTFIEQTLGGKHHRFKRGYKNVINEAIRLNQEGVACPLAIETSGHAAMKENYFLDDGAYLVTKIIIKAAELRRQGKTLDDLIAALGEPAEEKELRLKILAEDFKACGERIIQDLRDYAAAQNGWEIAPDNHEGIRISFVPEQGDGWLLLRLSVHDPILPLNAESDTPGGTGIILKAFYRFIQKYAELDLSPLDAYKNR